MELKPFILPTDNSSELFIDTRDYQLHTGQDMLTPAETWINQHIYLTSDAPIKEGYWVKSPTGNIHKADHECATNKCLKVEFTTDQKLTKPTFETGKISEWDKLVHAIDGNTKALIKNPNPMDAYMAMTGIEVIEVNFITEFCKRYNQKNNQKVDVEKLADEQYKKYEPIESPKYVSEQAIFVMGFSDGYNQAIQSQAGGFSLRNMLKDMNERIKYLETKPQSEENKWRERELTLAIIAVQQILLQSLTKESQSKEDIVIECEMEIEKRIYGATEPYEYKIKLKYGQPILTFK